MFKDWKKLLIKSQPFRPWIEQKYDEAVPIFWPMFSLKKYKKLIFLKKTLTVTS